MFRQRRKKIFIMPEWIPKKTITCLLSAFLFCLRCFPLLGLLLILPKETMLKILSFVLLSLSFFIYFIVSISLLLFYFFLSLISSHFISFYFIISSHFISSHLSHLILLSYFSLFSLVNLIIYF